MDLRQFHAGNAPAPAESAALIAMRRLAEVLVTASAEELQNSWLRLNVRLRSAADALIMAEAGETLRNEVQLGCQAYLEVVSQAADAVTPTESAAASLKQLRLRSARYLERVAEGKTHLVGHGGEHLRALLRAGVGTARRASGGPFGQRAAIGPGSALGFGSTGAASARGVAAAAAAGDGAGGGDGDGGGGDGGGPCVLTHGFSPYVVALLLSAARKEHFTLLVAEGRPDGSGHRTAEEMRLAGVPVRLIEFSAVARCMAQVQLVLVGAEAVLGDGGVLAPVGTLTIAYAAHAHGRPFYVAAPHHLFCRTHHLDATAQTIVRPSFGVPATNRSPILRERPTRDATPPQLVTLLLTDVGVLTTSAVADLDLQTR